MTININRREFIKKSLCVSSSAYLSSIPNYSCSQNNHSNISRVVIARNNLIRNSANSLNSTTINNLLNNAIESFLKISPYKKAWEKLFSKNDIVGIKINCLAGRGMSTSIELVDSIIENLLAIGINKNRIIVWDRANRDLKKGGYKIQTSSRDIKYYGNDHSGYTKKLYESGSIGSFLSNILVKQCSAIINVPILKDHGIVGITNALKNFFGAIHNPNKYHVTCGDPYIADLHLIPEIRNKVRLTICDLLTYQYEGGPPFMPQWAYNYNGLIVGADMVAIDNIAWEIIEKKRLEQNLPTLKSVGREPTYIKTAGDINHRIGICDKEKIDCQLID